MENAFFSGMLKKTPPPKKMKPERFSRHIFFPLIFLADKHDFPVTTEFTMNKNNPFHLFFHSAWHPNNAGRFQLSPMKLDPSKESLTWCPMVHENPWKTDELAHKNGLMHAVLFNLKNMSLFSTFGWPRSTKQSFTRLKNQYYFFYLWLT